MDFLSDSIDSSWWVLKYDLLLDISFRLRLMRSLLSERR